MAVLAVWVRILLGWLGVYLLAKGVPQEVVDALTNDPTTQTFLVEVVSHVVGAALMGIQIVYWQLARKFGWER